MDCTAAIHDQISACNHIGGIAGEKKRGDGYLFRQGKPAERDLLFHYFPRLSSPCHPAHFGEHNSWRDSVHLHAARSPLQRHYLRKTEESILAGAVGEMISQSNHRCLRRNVDNFPVALLRK